MAVKCELIGGGSPRYLNTFIKTFLYVVSGGAVVVCLLCLLLLYITV